MCRVGLVISLLLIGLGCGLAAASSAADAAANSGQAQPALTVSGFVFSGNESIKDEELQTLLADAVGRTLYIGELEDLAERVTGHYRAKGFLFSYAYLPEQAIPDGVVQIAIVEGRYGQIVVNNNSKLRDIVVRGHLRGLKPGDPIRRAPLERVVRILDDIPGIKSEGRLSNGDSPGTADLTVSLTDDRPLTGSLTVDNHGSEYTGRTRTGLQVRLENPLGWGDRLSIDLLGSGPGMRYGRLTYEGDLEHTEVRLYLSRSIVEYRLGGTFTGLDAYGRTETTSTEWRYPIVRSGTKNLLARLRLDNKSIRDSLDAVTLVTSKRVNVANLQVTGAMSSSDGGSKAFQVGLTVGNLRFGSPTLHAADAATAGTAGRYARLNVSGSWARPVAAATTLGLLLEGQIASKNLDSSEKMVLGGLSGLRAYSDGEVSGDQGWLGRIELKHAFSRPGERFGQMQGLLFVEGGQVQANRSPWWGSGGPGLRSLSDIGAGLIWSRGGLSFELIGATALGRTEPTSAAARPARGWAKMTWAF